MNKINKKEGTIESSSKKNPKENILASRNQTENVHLQTQKRLNPNGKRPNQSMASADFKPKASELGKNDANSQEMSEKSSNKLKKIELLGTKEEMNPKATLQLNGQMRPASPHFGADEGLPRLRLETTMRPDSSSSQNTESSLACSYEKNSSCIPSRIENFADFYKNGLIHEYKSSSDRRGHVPSHPPYLGLAGLGPMMLGHNLTSTFGNFNFLRAKDSLRNDFFQMDNRALSKPAQNPPKKPNAPLASQMSAQATQQPGGGFEAGEPQLHKSFLLLSYIHFEINKFYDNFIQKRGKLAETLGFEPFRVRYSHRVHKNRKNFLYFNKEPESSSWLDLYCQARSEKASEEQIRKLRTNWLSQAKHRIFQKFNCASHRAIFKILKLKHVESIDPRKFENADFEFENVRSERKNASFGKLQGSDDEKIDPLENNRDDHFQEFIAQRGGPAQALQNAPASSAEADKTGWEFSSCAFRYYHLQPLLFPRRLRASKRPANTKPDFSPNNMVNLNYFEYSLGKRHQVDTKSSTDSSASPVKRVKQKESQPENGAWESSPKKRPDNAKQAPSRVAATRDPRMTKSSRARRRRRKRGQSRSQRESNNHNLNLLDFRSIKKGTDEFRRVSQYYALSLDEVLELQDKLHEHVKPLDDSQVYADLSVLSGERTFKKYLDSDQPKIRFGETYDAGEKELSSKHMVRFRKMGKMIKLLKEHFGLNSSVWEIEHLLKSNRNFGVLERYIEFKDNRIRMSIENFRKENGSKLK